MSSVYPHHQCIILSKGYILKRYIVVSGSSQPTHRTPHTTTSHQTILTICASHSKNDIQTNHMQLTPNPITQHTPHHHISSLYPTQQSIILSKRYILKRNIIVSGSAQPTHRTAHFTRPHVISLSPPPVHH